MTKYDFTTPINRKNIGCIKWNLMYEANPDLPTGIVPFSVADMEFKNPPQIYQGLIDYLQTEPILGYTTADETFFEEIISWQKRRHHWDIQKEWIVNTPGVVAAIYAAVKQLTKPEDGVIIFRPVYYPFVASIEDNGRQEVNVPLIEKDGDYTIDFAAFEQAAKDPRNKLLIFCSPHNPVGRVWTKEELTKLAKIAVENDLYVVSDEIWNDLTTKEHPHTVLATINDEIAARTITCTATSKTFNLAGMAISNIIISNEKLRDDFKKSLETSRLNHLNALGYQSSILAYRDCEDWLEEVLIVIEDNMIFVKEYFEKNCPIIKAPVSEGTYLQWLDFRKLGLANEDLEKFLQEKALLYADEGYIFGEEGSGFERINVACPKSILEASLDRLLEALKNENLI